MIEARVWCWRCQRKTIGGIKLIQSVDGAFSPIHGIHFLLVPHIPMRPLSQHHALHPVRHPVRHTSQAMTSPPPVWQMNHMMTLLSINAGLNSENADQKKVIAQQAKRLQELEKKQDVLNAHRVENFSRHTEVDMPYSEKGRKGKGLQDDDEVYVSGDGKTYARNGMIGKGSVAAGDLNGQKGKKLENRVEVGARADGLTGIRSRMLSKGSPAGGDLGL